MKNSTSIFKILGIAGLALCIFVFAYACSDPFGKYNNPADPKISDGTAPHVSVSTVTTIATGTTVVTATTVATAFSIDLITVPAGTFHVGTADMQVSSFFIGKYDITQAQYLAVMGTNPSTFQPSHTAIFNPNLPVENVSWYAALVFCNKLSISQGKAPVYLIAGTTDPSAWGPIPNYNNTIWDSVTVNMGANGYRLPTDAEWQWAAMAADTSNIGNDFSGDDPAHDRDANLYVWWSDNSFGTTHQVAAKLPNALGIYDMSGNVEQWCFDWWASNYVSTNQINYQGPASGSSRVLRGGDWTKGLGAGSVSAIARSYIDPGLSGVPNGTIGFRVVVSNP